MQRLFRSAWVLAAVYSCGTESTAPGPVAEAYALETLNESALPYDHEGLGCCTYLNGALQLLQGRYTVSLTFRNRNSGSVFTAIEWGKYTELLSALSFALDSFAVSPLGLDAGIASGNEVRVTFGGEGPGSPDQFRAVFVHLP